MGVPKEQASRNRNAIIEAASRAFREHGVDGICLADLMKEAGFTHGGFYNHFTSKDDLAAEACAAAFSLGAANLSIILEKCAADKASMLRTLVETYLSPQHCDAPGQGCPSASLAVDAARQGNKMQGAYAKGIERFLEIISEHVDADAGSSPATSESREKAIDLLANMVGTIVLARGVGAANPQLSEEILATGRKHLLE